MKKILLAVVAVCVVLVVAFFVLRGMGKEFPLVSAREQPKKPVVLMLYAGAGIREATTELIDVFESRTGIEVDATYGTCGQLMAQITTHHAGDLFIVGDKAYVQQAIDDGLALAGTKRDVASFIPVIFVQKGNPKGIKTLWDLTQPGLRLGLCDERACVIGKKAMKILKKNKIPYEEIKPNVVYKAATSNPLGVAIQTGAVDAVITWDANARYFAEYGDIIEIPPSQNAPSVIPIVMLTSSRHPQEAQQFIEFVASEEGRKIMQERGFSPLNPSPTG